MEFPASLEYLVGEDICFYSLIFLNIPLVVYFSLFVSVKIQEIIKYYLCYKI